jgi:hypothetical protein
MKKVIKTLKILFCAYGGAVLASSILLVICTLFFGAHNFTEMMNFLKIANPIVGIVGALIGIFVVLRDERNRK